MDTTVIEVVLQPSPIKKSARMGSAGISWNDTTVTADNPQTSLWAIFIGNTELSSEETDPMETVDSEVCGLSRVTGTLQFFKCNSQTF